MVRPRVDVALLVARLPTLERDLTLVVFAEECARVLRGLMMSFSSTDCAAVPALSLSDSSAVTAVSFTVSTA